MGQYDEPGNDAAFFHPLYDERVDLSDIQANLIVPDVRLRARLLLLRIRDPGAFRAWLGDLPISPASAKLVEDVRLERVCTLGFTWAGLAMLAPLAARRLSEHSPAFAEGMHPRAGAHGLEPESPTLFAAGDRAHALLQLSADTDAALDDAEAETLGAAGTALEVLGRITCDRSAPGEAREHFGFADPVSQPGVFGWFQKGDIRASICRRVNPVNRWEGFPGQPLLPLGHFLLGHHTLPGTPGRDIAPALKGGAFVVATQLQQMVGPFHSWLAEQAAQHGVSPALVGSRVVGRWSTGTPTVRAPWVDDHDPATEACTWNNYAFHQQVPRVPVIFPKRDECRDAPPPGSVDPDGARCPFTAHVRKSNPRDMVGAAPSSGLRIDLEHSRKRMMLRRALPYGPPSGSTPESPRDDGADRGIVFIAVVASIETQFEEPSRILFDPAAPRPDAGPDALLGPAGRSVGLGALSPEAAPSSANAAERWVIPRGGVYLFAPPLGLVRALADGSAA